MNKNNIVIMAQDYVKQVYPNNPHPIQVEESQQHFIMGVWAMLQLALQMPRQDIDKLEKEIRSYQEERVACLMRKTKGPQCQKCGTPTFGTLCGKCKG